MFIAQARTMKQNTTTNPAFFFLAFFLLHAAFSAAQSTWTSPSSISNRTVSNPSGKGGNFGLPFALHEDFDGDGIDDFIATAVNERVDGQRAQGRAYLISSATGKCIRTISSPNPQASGFFGAAALGIEDINADGQRDLLISSLEDPMGHGPRSGVVYAYCGRSFNVLYTLFSPNAQTDGRFGEPLFEAGDLDGDGVKDFLVSAWHENDPSNSVLHPGALYAYSAATGSLLHEMRSAFPTDTGNFGRTAANLHEDLDGDGIDDILVGAKKEQMPGSPFQEGLTYIFSGASGIMLCPMQSPDPQHKGWWGNDLISLNEDVDRDGFKDYIVGANYENDPSRPDNAGRAYLISGKNTTVIKMLESPVVADGRYGKKIVALGGDIDGDGIGDFAISAWGDSEPGTPVRQGRIYVHSGRDGSLLQTIASPDACADGHFGRGMSALRDDVNGDGYPDLVGGASFETGPMGPLDVGQVHICSVYPERFLRQTQEESGTWTVEKLHNDGLIIRGLSDEEPLYWTLYDAAGRSYDQGTLQPINGTAQIQHFPAAQQKGYWIWAGVQGEQRLNFNWIRP
jgi:hypothetical protein